mgnify:CR=1 FL=1
MAAGQPEFIRRQYEFAAHIRDPDNRPAPSDVEERRMAIYRDLFYNNVEGFIANTFPVLRSLLDDTAWHAMVRDYFSGHRAQTPYFLEIPREFLAWLERERTPRDDDLPFLQELAHYEWVELALQLDERELDDERADPNGDLMAGIPVLSPLAWPLSYRFPVHEISPDNQPDAPGDEPTYLVVYRNRNDQVKFLEINPVTARLIGLLHDNSNYTGNDAIAVIAEQMSNIDQAVIQQGGKAALEELHSLGIILGTALDNQHQ